MDKYETISSLLSKQIEIYTDLLGLENEKTRILLEGKADKLDEILNDEQPLIMKSESLENERRSFQQNSGLGTVSLRQIIEDYPESRNYGLDGQFVKLSKLFEKIRKANGLNKRLVEAHLKTLRRFTVDSSVGPDSLTYTKEGIFS